jgi:hypothetical protein
LNIFKKSQEKILKYEKALSYVDVDNTSLLIEINQLLNKMNKIDVQINGNKSKKEIGEKDNPSVSNRLSVAQRGFFGNSYGPTKLQMESFDIAKKQWKLVKQSINEFIKSVSDKNKIIEQLGAPIIIN